MNQSSIVCLPVVLTLASSFAVAQTTTFSNQTAAAGITALHSAAYSASFAAGGAVGDFNRDGYQDIFLASGGNFPDRLYINQGDGTFLDRAAAWGIAATHRGTGAVVGDFDNDGWLDLYVTSLGPVNAGAPGYHKLYHNLGGYGFSDVAVAMGVNSTGTADGWGGAFGDYDNDGDLDLAVCGWLQGASNRLFRNDGGTFTDVTVSSGIAPSLTNIHGFAIKWADMDGDQDQDLIWIGDFGTSKYFVNNGNGTFTDFTAGSGTAHDGTEMGVTVTDINEDGLLDFYVTTINSNNLYINQGNNVFVNQANSAAVEFGGWGWGTVAIDMNHDTLLDLVATSASSNQYAFRNVSPTPQNLQFQEVASSIGLNSLVSGRGLSNIDFDNDGDQDLVIFPHNGPLQLFRNDLTGPDTHWLRVFLERGCSSSVPADGVGATVQATVGTRTWTRLVEAGNNYLSNSELSAHFGLGAASVVDTLTVNWPDGQVSTLVNVAVDQTLTILAPSSAACSHPIGAGCAGSNGVPELAPLAGSLPALGATFTLAASGLDQNGWPAVLAGGLDQAKPGVELSSLGLPGCRFHVGGTTVQFFTLANVGGAATWSFALPSNPALQGTDLFFQAVAFDSGLPNAFGAVVSNGLRARAN